jgi:hypothetical protein
MVTFLREAPLPETTEGFTVEAYTQCGARQKGFELLELFKRDTNQPGSSWKLLSSLQTS